MDITSSISSTSTAADARIKTHQLSKRTTLTGSALLLLSFWLITTIGCSRFTDLDEQDRLSVDLSSSSCVACHTSESIMIAMLGEEIEDDGGGGGG